MFRILVVEDNEELNRTICSYLNKNDFEAIPCLNASQALEKLYVGNCDLIISDIMMPGMDGFELAKKIRVHNENLPILFLTAKDDFASKQRCCSTTYFTEKKLHHENTPSLQQIAF
ncbi:MAG: response regulator, partial [Clostridia bacterium]|nr:response regulator [Clostridia bacterium]